MKTIIPSADRTAGRRGAGRRRTKRFATNRQFHPQQRRFDRETIEFVAFALDAMGEDTTNMHGVLPPTGRKAFVS